MLPLTLILTEITHCTTHFVTLSNPLEQFEVAPLCVLSNIALANTITVMLFFALCSLVFVVSAYLPGGRNNYDFFVEGTYDVVQGMLRENLYIRKQQYFSIVFFLFSMLMALNMVGLVPYVFTATSAFTVTFFLAAMHFIGITIIGVVRHRWNFFNSFLPAGAPLAIAPFLILIEFVSFVARVFSLSIRLFANMMSGHALLKILINFAWIMLISGSVLVLFAPIPWIIVTAVIFLEVLIAFLQAYVFSILVTLYINDAINLH